MSTPAREVHPFDLHGPLPEATTVLEASAGTGKTYTIAALVARLVAEGVAGLDEMLIVTFSRAATGELRERVRERLTSAELGLADPAAARSSSDELLALLAGVSEAEVAQRRRRLTRALTAFDAATIATTHQFSAQVLAGLGVTAELAAVSVGDRFVESLDDLVTEVAEDLYLRKFAVVTEGAGSLPGIPPDEARRIAVEAVIREPQARLEPLSAPADSPAGMRRRLAEAVRGEVERRKRQRGLRSYDDLQIDLAAVLRDPIQGERAASRLRERFPVVLIDEFQDTDPVQWEIVSLAFVDHVRLVLIGDPKQAVYGFRGADVTAYLSAVRSAGDVATLERNWRSEPALLEAFDALFAGCTFGDPAIAYRPVVAARSAAMLRGAVASAPMRLRVVARAPGDPLSGGGQLRVETLRPRIAQDVAREIVALLDSDAQIAHPGLPPAAPDLSKGPDPDCRGLQPGDVAVLVRTNAQAALMREALGDAGVPAVIGGATSVFTAQVAGDWLILLEALEQPHRTGRVRAAAMTCFLAWSASRLALADPEQTDALSGLLRSWAGVLATRGVAALLETIMSSQQLPARLLGEVDGERRLTDLRHIGETLHAAATADGLGITALVAWLRRRIGEADDVVDGVEERSRRLESDADAVQVVTIHRSKGLQFPVVYVPFAWDLYLPVVERPRYHDGAGERVLDVGSGLGGSDPAAFNAGALRHRLEEAAEQLRLLYVAVTRARSQVVLWWAPATTAECAPLTRLLFGLAPGAREPEMTVVIPSDADIVSALETRFAAASDRVRVEPVVESGPLRWSRLPSAAGELSAATFERDLDLAWRRTSYSGLTAAAHDAGAGSAAVDPAAAVGSEPEHAGLDDEPTEPDGLRGLTAGADGDPAAAVTSPMALLPGGTSFGSLVHAVLEVVDTSAVELGDEISARVGEQLSRWAPPAGTGMDADQLAAALMAVYETPLGPVAEGLRLRDFPAKERLTELGFELPLCGGDRPGRRLVLGSLGPLVRGHLTAAQPADPLAPYADRLGEPLLRDQSLRGFLNGSLDAVLRVRAADGGPRYVVVDYKTNWLSSAPPGSGNLTAADYTPARLTEAMLGSDYPLQALLYSVALHRYLRWRQPGYQPEVHLGGVLYLYLRGMCGPQTPVVDGHPCGVFAWRPPAQLIVDLSDALDTGDPSR
jgi:exodeoxyribonuclease V beta subunit